MPRILNLAFDTRGERSAFVSSFGHLLACRSALTSLLHLFLHCPRTAWPRIWPASVNGLAILGSYLRQPRIFILALYQCVIYRGPFQEMTEALRRTRLISRLARSLLTSRYPDPTPAFHPLFVSVKLPLSFHFFNPFQAQHPFAGVIETRHHLNRMCMAGGFPSTALP